MFLVVLELLRAKLNFQKIERLKYDQCYKYIKIVTRAIGLTLIITSSSEPFDISGSKK